MGLEPTTPCLQTRQIQNRHQRSIAKPQVKRTIDCPGVPLARHGFPRLRARIAHEIEECNAVGGHLGRALVRGDRRNVPGDQTRMISTPGMAS
jgi:hypothetical protein